MGNRCSDSWSLLVTDNIIEHLVVMTSRMDNLKIPRKLRSLTAEILGVNLDAGATPQEPTAASRGKRCAFCPSKKDHKTSTSCHNCKKPISLAFFLLPKWGGQFDPWVVEWKPLLIDMISLLPSYSEKKNMVKSISGFSDLQVSLEFRFDFNQPREFVHMNFPQSTLLPSISKY
nr:unnamed protein product [Callosobruchus chinensis]